MACHVGRLISEPLLVTVLVSVPALGWIRVAGFRDLVLTRFLRELRGRGASLEVGSSLLVRRFAAHIAAVAYAFAKFLHSVLIFCLIRGLCSEIKRG